MVHVILLLTLVFFIIVLLFLLLCLLLLRRLGPSKKLEERSFAFQWCCSIREQACFCCCCCSCFFFGEILFTLSSASQNTSLRPVSPGDGSKTPCWWLSGAALSGFSALPLSLRQTRRLIVSPPMCQPESSKSQQRAVSPGWESHSLEQRRRAPATRVFCFTIPSPPPTFPHTHTCESKLLGIISGKLTPLLPVLWYEGYVWIGLLEEDVYMHNKKWFLFLKSGINLLSQIRIPSVFLPVGGSCSTIYFLSQYFCLAILTVPPQFKVSRSKLLRYNSYH